MAGRSVQWQKVLGLVVCALCAAACSSGSSADVDASDDVEVLSCELSAGVLHTARVEVTNQATEAATYRVRVAFASPDHETTYGDSPEVVIRNLEPGARRRVRLVLGPEGEDPTKTMDCTPRATRSTS